jgi:hypothetical protein
LLTPRLCRSPASHPPNPQVRDLELACGGATIEPLFDLSGLTSTLAAMLQPLPQTAAAAIRRRRNPPPPPPVDGNRRR